MGEGALGRLTAGNSSESLHGVVLEVPFLMPHSTAWTSIFGLTGVLFFQLCCLLEEGGGTEWAMGLQSGPLCWCVCVCVCVPMVCVSWQNCGDTPGSVSVCV